MKRRIPNLQHVSTVTHGLETGRLCRLLAGKQARDDVTNVYLSDLALVDISDGSVERIARRVKVMDYWLSPDGTKIAFTTMKKDSYDIVVVSLADYCPRVVASDIQNEKKFPVSWSPDSNLLSYTSEGNCFIAPAGGGGAQNLAGSSQPNFDHVYPASL